MKPVIHLMIIGAFLLSFSAVSYAQMQASPPGTPATPAAPATPKAKKAPMSAKAKECSDKATAQGLHGKARKEFREKCKKGET
jgi:psiF repeat